MAKLNYGFSGFNKSQNPQLSNSPYSKGSSNSIKGLLLPARVISIVLDNNHPRFEELGGWNALGAIEFDSADNPSYNLEKYSVAFPIDSNFKHFPLKNEIVLILSSFSSAINLFENNINILGGESKKYYTSIINVWNHPHHNGYSFKINDSTPSQNKTYDQTQTGNTSTISDEPVKINLGKTFKERSNIHPLLPFEGDIIYEGRWGNSIRLGSTVMASASLSPNDWSSPGVGKNGDPIIILRNGEFLDTKIEGYKPIVENTYNSLSSIYLTSTQKIPIDVARSNYTNYSGSLENVPANPKEYAGPQIILNSERLIFNASLDHILLSAGKSINLNTPKSVNIDTRKLVVQSDAIYLGNEMLANEPLMLGNKTVLLLINLVDILISLTDQLKNLQSDPVVANAPASFAALNIKSSGINSSLKQIKKQLEKPNSITSERNYTI